MHIHLYKLGFTFDSFSIYRADMHSRWNDEMNVVHLIDTSRYRSFNCWFAKSVCASEKLSLRPNMDLLIDYSRLKL